MVQFYFLKRGWLFCLSFFVFIASQSVSAQQNNTPFEQVFVTANLNKENLKKDFPHLYQVVKNKDYKTEDINSFIKAHGTEWNSFCHLPAVMNLNIAWSTLGLVIPEPKKEFPHSLYQWYKASGISEAKRNQLFPHFPLPDLKKDANKELADYEAKIGAWQRLYTEEYEHFLNAPELTALNPYYTGYYKFPYLPKFIGQDIELEKPTKPNTGNAIADDYHYQMKLRNWYFVFKPQEFDRLYGKDYKFPESFNQQEYRDHMSKILKEKKAGTYPNLTNPH